ncbi:MAG: efflux RND transporter periplasmic adaptor subunit [Holosporales bacterium]|jgi:membrane fusion protein (multidrug efflux system)|nr:efflux RND transporter periplasmic adaptor subunit [Holosporales bacterium]
MFEKIKKFLYSSYLFWKKAIIVPNKKEFFLNNINSLKNHVIMLLAIFFSLFIFLNAMKPAVRGICRIVLRNDEADAMDAFDRKLVGVEAEKAKLGTTLRQVKSIGTLKANAEVTIKAEISGKIKEICFIEGGSVEKDQELIKFEDEYFKAEKNKAEAGYILHKAEYDRMEKLYKQKVGALKDYDKTLAEMNSAKANLESAEYQLSKTIIKAPFSGVIGIMRATPGNIVQQHTDLVTIVDNSSVKVEFVIPAKYVEDIAVGQSVDITVDSFPDKVFTGAVDAVDSEVDTRNHGVLVRAVIPNPTGVLKHGLFANVTLVIGEKSDVLLINEDALDREGSIDFVWVIDDKGRAYRRRVLIGAKDTHGVEIVAGLKEGENVVIAGHLKLSDGCRTRVLDNQNEEDNESSFSGEGEKTDEFSQQGLATDSFFDQKNNSKSGNDDRQNDASVVDDKTGEEKNSHHDKDTIDNNDDN